MDQYLTLSCFKQLLNLFIDFFVEKVTPFSLKVKSKMNHMEKYFHQWKNSEVPHWYWTTTSRLSKLSKHFFDEIQLFYNILIDYFKQFGGSVNMYSILKSFNDHWRSHFEIVLSKKHINLWRRSLSSRIEFLFYVNNIFKLMVNSIL